MKTEAAVVAAEAVLYTSGRITPTYTILSSVTGYEVLLACNYQWPFIYLTGVG